MIAVVLSLFLGTAQAAPCCAGNSAAPSIIAGDDQAQLGVMASRAEVIGDAPEQGLPVFRSALHDEITQTYRIDGALLLADRWQAGLTLPVVQRSYRYRAQSASAWGLGDVRASAAYEILPEWNYSVWKPKGFLFTEISLPTGRSIHEARAPGMIDATGRGFYSAALGLLLQKRWSSWDVFLIPETHYSFARSFTESVTGEVTTVRPGWGGSVALGGGYSFSAFRIGTRVQPIYEQPKTIETAAGSQRTSQQLVWNAGLDLTWLVSDEWSLTGAYSDQTLLGPAINTTLSRVASLNLQHLWSR
jgi:hypothetical protein